MIIHLIQREKYMPYTDEYARVEREFGEKMTTLLPRLMTLHGVDNTAEMLHVAPATIWKWNAERVGSHRVCVYVHDVDLLYRLLGYAPTSADAQSR